MKLHSVLRARVIWLFPFGDINPSGKYLYPILGELIKRYKFANIPNIPEAIKKNEGIIFSQGSFSLVERGELSADIGIYNDGLIGDTRADTDASGALLDDMLTWVQKEYGLRYPDKINKKYLSEVYVSTKKSLTSLNPKLAAIARRITEKSPNPKDVSYSLGGIIFATEQKSPNEPPFFRFERAPKVPYEDNRYYSLAGLPTADHMELLNELEKALAD